VKAGSLEAKLFVTFTPPTCSDLSTTRLSAQVTASAVIARAVSFRTSFVAVRRDTERHWSR
jgi:hypothetical protein